MGRDIYFDRLAISFLSYLLGVTCLLSKCAVVDTIILAKLMYSHPTQLTEADQPLRGLQILLVEDELDVASLLLFVLQTAGSRVKLCIEAEDALLALDTFQPDVLVSNIKLPSQDGTWLIQQIRSHSRPEIQHLPAIGVTSYDRDVCISCALDSGFDCFLSKLDPPDGIVDAIASLVNRS